jgi:Cu-Zn family superoxide dismutase
MTRQTRRLARTLLCAGTGAALAASAAMAQEPVTSGTTVSGQGTVMARLTLADGTDVGRVTLKPMRAGVHVEIDLSDLPPGPHGFHIHETGACTPDFAAAGEHLAPDGHEHGFAQTEEPHAGDLPNIWVASDGNIRAEFVNWRLAMDDLFDADGSAMIIHGGRDTYADPDSAGERIACGVIEQQS